MMQMPVKGFNTLQLNGVMHNVQSLSAWRYIVQQVRSLHTCWRRSPMFVQLSVGIRIRLAVCAGLPQR